jgi:hypothetical protein
MMIYNTKLHLTLLLAVSSEHVLLKLLPRCQHVLVISDVMCC